MGSKREPFLDPDPSRSLTPERSHSTLSGTGLKLRLILRIFKYSFFNKWAKRVGIANRDLKKTIEEMEKGLNDGSLGGNVFKKRIGLKGRGKSGGFRTIIGYKKEDKAIFFYGYAKNVRDNISAKEKEAFKKLAKGYFSLSDSLFQELIDEEIFEVK